jgi:nitronate monooxygenase
MKWNNQLTTLLKVKYPIIQAPMLGITTPEMVAAVSNLQGLGSLPIGGLSPEKTLELIKQTKALTSCPFAVNLFSHDIPIADEQTFERMQDLVEKICVRNQMPYKRQMLKDFRFYSYKEQIDHILNEHLPIVSFTFGMLDTSTIKKFKKSGTILIGTATCLKEAQLLCNAGIDVITAQGIEAGGHRGTFLQDQPLPMIPLISLVSEISAHCDIPLIAAGSINSGKTIKTAFTTGALGVQIGTAFMASNESAAIPALKNYLKETSEEDSILTKAFSGRWARGLRNKFINEIEASGLVIPDYPIQNSVTTPIRTIAQKNNNKEFTNLWAGLAAHKTEMKPTATLFMELIKQTEEESQMFLSD